MASTSCHQFSLSEINEATNNFDPVKFIGHGGEGDVYLAHIYLDHHKNEKTPVAVKLLNANSTEFDSEVEIISKIQHPHLVSLLGYCKDSGKKILVYEYMEKGNLSVYIDNNSSVRLSWKQRLNICLGAARGLQHLHSETPELPKGIIHRDVKPANILLDGNWAAKVSDFGMFKLSHAGQTDSAMATGLKGTSGYYAPEYVRTHQITRKIDVYALGVVMFEVLCRKKPWERGDESYYVKDDEDLGAWAQENVDPEIEGEISRDCLEAFTDVIGSSLQQDSSKRPTMNDVVTDLQHALRLQELEDEAMNKLQISMGQFTGFRRKVPSTILHEARAEYEPVDTYVCDVGEAFTKVGYSYRDSPEAVFETAVNLTYLEELTNPFDGGIVTNWPEYFRVLCASFIHNQRASYLYGSRYPVLLTEPQPHLKHNPINDSEKVSYMKARENLVTKIFEEYKVPALYVAAQPVLSLYANGLTTGIVVESGEGFSSSVPIYEGHVLPHAITSLKLAGKGLTNHFLKTLNFKTSNKDYTEHQLMRGMKEKMAYIALDYSQELLRTSNAYNVRYELPDGQHIALGFERFHCPEALFNPSIIGMDDEAIGIHKNTYNSINMCDPEIRDQLYGNIVLSGGTTMLPGFANRLKREITMLTRRGSRSPIKIWAPENRMHGAWVGGSVMASLSTFKNMWISRAEYDAYGPNIVHRKCF